LAYQLFDAPAVSACSRALEEPFLVDASQADESAEGPSAFQAVSAFSYRIEGTRCSGNSCAESSCGDQGVLVLAFEPPVEASQRELGYRMIWVGRPLPFAIRSQLDRVLPLDPSTREASFELGFDAIARLDGELSLVAVDRAGHESAPSELARVSFSGCTEYFDQPYCVEGGPMPQSDAARCSVLHGVGQKRSSPLTAALALSLCTLLWSRRKRSS
jgi:hypothetical protein